MESFGERLKKERERLGMTQVAFAAACGVGKTAQYTYEANDRHPDALYLGFAMSAGANVGYILSGSRQHPGIDFAARLHVINKIDEELILSALGNVDLEGFSGSISNSDIDAAKNGNLAPMIQKLVSHTPELRMILEGNKNQGVDSGILEWVLREMETSSTIKALPAEKRARIAAFAYRLAVQIGAVDKWIIEGAVSLAAPDSG